MISYYRLNFSLSRLYKFGHIAVMYYMGSLERRRKTQDVLDHIDAALDEYAPKSASPLGDEFYLTSASGESNGDEKQMPADFYLPGLQ